MTLQTHPRTRRPRAHSPAAQSVARSSAAEVSGVRLRALRPWFQGPQLADNGKSRVF